MFLQAVVLCGGNSLRMGSDKGMMRRVGQDSLQAGTWAQTAVECLSILGNEALISVNPGQYPEYGKVFNPNRLVTDNASLQLNGPLKGLLSVHLHVPAADLLVLACDMPLMQQDIITLLHKLYTDHPNHDAYLFTNDGQPEPLCAIYTAEALNKIYQDYKQGKLLKHSMKYMISRIHAFFHPLTHGQKTSFRNFNAHSELNGL